MALANLCVSVRRRHISQFIDGLLRPRVLKPDLEAAYLQMADDVAREAEALEWAEATIRDVQDEAR